VEFEHVNNYYLMNGVDPPLHNSQCAEISHRSDVEIDLSTMVVGCYVLVALLL
jgi:hypothetical protein